MLQELYVVLEGLPNGKWKTCGNTEHLPVFIGEGPAERLAEDFSGGFLPKEFKAFPLNSAEAFEAIHGEKGVDFTKGDPLEEARFRLAAEPLMRYLAHTHHPHTKVIVDSTSAELVEGMRTHLTDKFLVD